MRTEDALRRLAEHQDRILAALENASSLLGAGPETARVELAKVRWTMSRILREYQLFKHIEIFNPAIARGTPVQAEHAARLKRACLALGHKHAAHLTRWNVGEATANWPEYRSATCGMIAELRTHIRRERLDVARLLAGSERTRRLAATS